MLQYVGRQQKHCATTGSSTVQLRAPQKVALRDGLIEIQDPRTLGLSVQAGPGDPAGVSTVLPSAQHCKHAVKRSLYQMFLVTL